MERVLTEVMVGMKAQVETGLANPKNSGSPAMTGKQ
jgi:hypothetical protein